MARPRIDLLDRLQYIALRVVAMCAHSWPVALNLQIARLVGTILYRVDRKHRDRAHGNLRRSFPNMTDRQIARVAEESMQHMCMLAVEVMFTTRLIRIDTFATHIQLERFNESLA